MPMESPQSNRHVSLALPGCSTGVSMRFANRFVTMFSAVTLAVLSVVPMVLSVVSVALSIVQGTDERVVDRQQSGRGTL